MAMVKGTHVCRAKPNRKTRSASVIFGMAMLPFGQVEK